MDYDLLVINANKRLQSLLNLSGNSVDGKWGLGSQNRLIGSQKKFGYSWTKLRQHFGSFSQSQVDGFNEILKAINEFGSEEIKPAYVAYMLATTWHETARTMKPISEYGGGKGRPYGSRIDIDGSRYSSSLPIYAGKGYVQLTWLTNYVKMKKILGVDFVNHPELALVPKHAADIMIVGMLNGVFTGKSLKDYIDYGLYPEFIRARRIINGTDKQTTIAQYAAKFLDSLVII